ncbi:NUDIX domain-containing protein [Plastoroseomonas arctica]|uniref:ADP-ribose pyrophosphatase n=1 Tax=Plastoroseomonas arctica TaxID=1509237 RepID=A0AAF1KUD3_9PROT|nr:NUDIX domain-containing protein [Plastoroseomonas arctica]MBR0655977.1 NUDIX domain-containing protein [Plastoroseomonas arctica]
MATTPIPPFPGLNLLDQETVWNGRFPLDRIRFRKRRFDGAEGGLLTWELRRRGRAAAILPYDAKRDRVALIEQFRLPALAAGMHPVMTEVPAGLCEPGEDPAETARRELAEETQLVPTALEALGRYILNQGDSDETIHLYLARCDLPDLLPMHHGLAAEHEDIRLRLLPAKEAIEMLDDNRIENATAALCLHWLARHHARLLREWK